MEIFGIFFIDEVVMEARLNGSIFGDQDGAICEAIEVETMSRHNKHEFGGFFTEILDNWHEVIFIGRVKGTGDLVKKEDLWIFEKTTS